MDGFYDTNIIKLFKNIKMRKNYFKKICGNNPRTKYF